MTIFDAHIHASNTATDPAALLATMKEAGIHGGCIFSNCPPEYNPQTGTSYEERMEEVMAWTKGYEDRLFPVLWIHPYEENVIEKVRDAARRGICAFKMICNNFFVYEEVCLDLLREIAALDKPVFFHSGILWDEGVSSPYNRPLNWEAVLPIEGLRFSMGHCSWPWIDDCIAMYGKFRFARFTKNTAEMFFDTTPGTPFIYREELFTKLFRIGYDVGRNVFFGTDGSAHAYNTQWTEECLRTDCALMDKMGISYADRNGMFYRNLLRFLGKEAPAEEETDPVSAVSHGADVPAVITKWYKKLDFPAEYDGAFYRALKEIAVSDAITCDTYNLEETDGRRNLLSFLFFCEGLEAKYKAKGLSEELLLASLRDIVRWTNVWTDLKGDLYLGELPWLKRHFDMRLFTIGRLQFGMAKAKFDSPEKGISEGDDVIEIHIPAGAPLSSEDCDRAITEAKRFFATYYPAYDGVPYVCGSWLLDPTLRELLPSDSNILAFASRFDVVKTQVSDSILKFVFRWNTSRVNLRHALCVSPFAEKVKAYAMSGKDFFFTTGVLK